MRNKIKNYQKGLNLFKIIFKVVSSLFEYILKKFEMFGWKAKHSSVIECIQPGNMRTPLFPRNFIGHWRRMTSGTFHLITVGRLAARLCLRNSPSNSPSVLPHTSTLVRITKPTQQLTNKYFGRVGEFMWRFREQNNTHYGPLKLFGNFTFSSNGWSWPSSIFARFTFQGRNPISLMYNFGV